MRDPARWVLVRRDRALVGRRVSERIRKVIDDHLFTSDKPVQRLADPSWRSPRQSTLLDFRLDPITVSANTEGVRCNHLHVKRVYQSPRRDTSKRATEERDQGRVNRHPGRCGALFTRWQAAHDVAEAIILKEVQRRSEGVSHCGGQYRRSHA